MCFNMFGSIPYILHQYLVFSGCKDRTRVTGTSYGVVESL